MRKQFIQLVLDLLLVTIAGVGAIWLLENFDVKLARLLALLPHLAMTLIAAVPILLANGAHRSVWRLSVLNDYVRVAGAAVGIVFVATTLGFLVNRLDGVARSLPVMQTLLMICLMVGARLLARERHVRRQRPSVTELDAEKVGTRDTVLVVGINRLSELYLQTVSEYGTDRAVVAGLLGRSAQHSGRVVQQQKVLGTPEEVASVLRELEVHGVFVNKILLTVPFLSLSDEARDALIDVERSSEIRLDFFAERVFDGGGPSARLSGGLTGPAVIPKAAADPGLSALRCSVADIDALRRNPYLRWKRLIDFCAASLLAVLTLPLMLLIAVVVAVDFGLPTMFWQQRPGRNGVPFRVYKFRTMKEAHDRNGQRIADANRTTVMGDYLRRFRLDELPQLWDILRGDMSFVGPRPLLPVDQSSQHSARLLMRPGLTGWAQVKGGREVSLDDKAALDIWYVHNASFKLDMRILALTVPMVLYGERIDHASIIQAQRELSELGFYSR
jgi:lipopolysaccharide/colanic/teichoic acid biosynthesis glycosyltransferase